jgi:hypothetical protein
MALKNKTILIISPQPWSNMFVSKHHYAIELSKRGNTIYFLQPSSAQIKEQIKIEQLKDYPTINIITHKKFVGEILRFHYRPLYKYLLQKKIKKILKALPTAIDTVLNFDNTGKYTDLSIFKAKTRIFFPVDQVNNKHILEYINCGDFIFSVTQNILDTFKSHNSTKILLNHGIGSYWEEKAKTPPIINNAKNINIGYFGNLNFGKGLDMATLQKLISKHKNIKFHFWGNNKTDNNTNIEVVEWINFLKNSENVILYGSTSPEVLVKQLEVIDAFILCYNHLYELNKCSNSHKILEYLSTGKVIISNKMSSYNEHQELINMLAEFNNNDYIQLFENTIENIEHYNSSELQQKRKDFALENTYKKHIKKIESYLD